MKKFILCQALCLLSFMLFAQGTFTHINDPSNPISKFSNIGGYRGAAWIDLNNDGWIDLFAAPNHIFRNLGNGNFDTIKNSITTGAAGNAGAASCSFADYDNDGDLDLLLGSRISRIYKNDGSGNLTVDPSVYSSLQNYPAWAGSFGDVNNDGRMDAVLAYANGFIPGTTPSPCFFLIQNDQGKLDTIVGDYDFTNKLEPYTVPYWSDFDQDGDMDLFIASGPAGTPGKDFCYRNMFKETGKDTLERITDLAFAKDFQDGQCYNFIDYDNDGDLDLCITNYTGEPTRLYKNNNGVYQLINEPFSIVEGDLSNCWGDFDNDGDLDVIISSDFPGHIHYYRNDGNDVFTEQTFSFSSLQQGSSVAAGDYDNDGDLDLFIMSNSSAIGLYRNDNLSGSNHWVTLTCEGSISNKSAIGTRVRLKCSINGKPTWQLREINAMNNFMGENDLRVHFGLADATIIDSLEIFYLSGIEETFTNVSVDRFYKEVEGSGSLQLITGIITPPVSSEKIEVFPNPASNVLTINLSAFSAGKKWQCIILNSAGEEVYSKIIIQSNSADVPVANLPKGIYLIRLISDTLMYSSKFEKF